MPAGRRAQWALAAGVLLALLLAVLAWRFTPLAEFFTPDRLAGWFRRIGSSPWSVAIIIGVYVVAGFAVLPLTALILATALVFEAPAALAVSLAGSLANAIVLYAFAARIARRPVQRAFGPRIRKASEMLADRGVIAVAIVRTIPVAPYTVVNLAAGLLRVPFFDYVAGTTLGLLPGLVLITLFGQQLREIWREPTPARVGLLVAIVVAWIAISLGLQRLTSRRRERRRASSRQSDGAP